MKLEIKLPQISNFNSNSNSNFTARISSYGLHLSVQKVLQTNYTSYFYGMSANNLFGCLLRLTDCHRRQLRAQADRIDRQRTSYVDQVVPYAVRHSTCIERENILFRPKLSHLATIFMPLQKLWRSCATCKMPNMLSEVDIYNGY